MFLGFLQRLLKPWHLHFKVFQNLDAIFPLILDMGNAAQAILYNEINTEKSSKSLRVIFDHNINKWIKQVNK